MKKFIGLLCATTAGVFFTPAVFSQSASDVINSLGGASCGSGGCTSQCPSSGCTNTNTTNQNTTNYNNSAQNQQSAIGNVDQAPIGGINNNTQINNAMASDFGFGPGIFCRGPHISIGAYGGRSMYDNTSWGNNFSNAGGFASLNIPLDGDVSKSCKSLAKEIVLQRQLDTSYNMIKICLDLKRQNVSLDYETFPQFKLCDSIFIASKPEVKETLPPRKIENNKVIRGLW